MSAKATLDKACPNAIDVHHHFVPPDYLKEIPAEERLPPLKAWTPAGDLEDLDRAGTQTVILSITTPGVWFGDVQKARALARMCNDYSAKMIAANPGRYRMFAALPLPDVEGTLAEIDYALDTLKAEGVEMFTSYEKSWLGDERFAPVFAELDRRKAIVHVHPTENQCCRNLMPDLQPFLGPAVLEYGTDTTRTIVSYLFSGAARRYPNVRMIFSHSGGTMPFLIERLQRQASLPGALDKLPAVGLDGALAAFYYDTAQSSNPVAQQALKKVVPVSQILFGTDCPFRTSIDHVNGLKRCGYTDAELAAIFRGNALRLIPTLPLR